MLILKIQKDCLRLKMRILTDQVRQIMLMWGQVVQAIIAIVLMQGHHLNRNSIKKYEVWSVKYKINYIHFMMIQFDNFLYILPSYLCKLFYNYQWSLVLLSFFTHHHPNHLQSYVSTTPYRQFIERLYL